MLNSSLFGSSHGFWQIHELKVDAPKSDFSLGLNGSII